MAASAQGMGLDYVAADDANRGIAMDLTQRDIEVTASVLWNTAAEYAGRNPAEAVGDFNRLATQYGALSILFCGRDEDTELLFGWLKESARAMADYYIIQSREAA